MSWWEVLLVVLAGVWAGGINTVVGSGTLVTFPTLLAMGVPPVTANVSNSIGLVAGGITGTWGYLPELRGAKRLVLRLVPMSLLGAVIGALLLLWLPAEAFETIVPVLIGIGLLLVIFGPRMQRWTARQHHDGVEPRWQVVALMSGVLVAGVYGGYFGAAQGVILIGLLSSLSPEPLQRLNGVKNALGTVVNAVGSLVFVVVSPELVSWTIVLAVGCGALVGGLIGARVGRRLPPVVLRSVIVVIGVVGIVKMVFFP
ncbi:sulfite exporter TauE/SafE family protein [Janibacter melonis]|uniref:sulfite exporter TauE/SafE family protein n=1 Tax=Janibacter melonis TaxID=262209 RepID=UPI00191B7603|nr:sulfite exporter TauE/SafE family protein [Janibacter melonis]